jgi:hypothetical protein
LSVTTGWALWFSFQSILYGECSFAGGYHPVTIGISI